MYNLNSKMITSLVFYIRMTSLILYKSPILSLECSKTKPFNYLIVYKSSCLALQLFKINNVNKLIVYKGLNTSLVTNVYSSLLLSWKLYLNQLLKFQYTASLLCCLMSNRLYFQLYIINCLPIYIEKLIGELSIDLKGLRIEVPITYLASYFLNYINNMEVIHYPKLLTTLAKRIVTCLLELLKKKYNIKRLLLEFNIRNKQGKKFRQGPYYYIFNNEQIKNLLFENERITAVSSKRILKINFEKEYIYLIEKVHFFLTRIYFQYNGGKVNLTTTLDFIYEE